MGVYMPTISSPRQGTSDNGLALRLLVQHAYTQDTAPDKSPRSPTCGHARMRTHSEKLPEPANNIIAECHMPLANADRRRACGAHALARCVPCVYVVACVYVVGHS